MWNLETKWLQVNFQNTAIPKPGAYLHGATEGQYPPDERYCMILLPSRIIDLEIQIIKQGCRPPK